MCRKRALAATALLALTAASPALAWGSKAAKPAAAQPAAKPAPAPPATDAEALPKPTKATPQERAAAERMEPLGRAAFWASQFNADPKDIEAGMRLTAALRALGRYEEATNTIQQVLVSAPDNVDALLESARVAVAGGQGFFGVAPARKAMALAPKDWRAPSLLGVSLAQIGRTAEAAASHQKALELAPNNPLVLSNAAMFYAAQGDNAQAETLLRKAIKSPDAGVQVRQNLALVLGMQGKFAESEQIQREDLPPKMADNNMAYLKAAYDSADKK